MTELVVALVLMLGTVGLAGRWATAKQRRLHGPDGPAIAPIDAGEEPHAGHH